MMLKNAIAIGKGLGKFQKVKDFGALRATFKSYLRLLVEIDVSKPLKPSFLFHRQGGDAIWVFLKYERLGDYCMDCGMISHKKHGCRSPPKLITPEKYKVSLKVMILSNLLPEPFTILELTSGESSQSSSLASHLH
jgi:hypothetical protein